ncbi:Uncharacterised protein [Mycobacteroides abscessus subsp. abscessus]|nr:Uncharacterised protein [Mycobacteroides abscessus subsp. abscessus]SLF12916.1 Uncharacterised protein [Mycobacteroides abscessus subsp. massiliense]SII60752.1 Uncharacterised protein [Mycobacteroides abscessus subsp. abscessus]SKK96523.1 Uncharacterised protein [Mycobacteroides abscessus subsp. abscessus]SKO12407.1 Uncharacterised protein [Mycobacteroides abscessus subsp. abscessus]
MISTSLTDTRPLKASWRCPLLFTIDTPGSVASMTMVTESVTTLTLILANARLTGTCCLTELPSLNSQRTRVILRFCAKRSDPSISVFAYPGINPTEVTSVG